MLVQSVGPMTVGYAMNKRKAPQLRGFFNWWMKEGIEPLALAPGLQAGVRSHRTLHHPKVEEGQGIEPWVSGSKPGALPLG